VCVSLENKFWARWPFS